MAKDPAFLFYTGDFSTGTQFFDDEQLGKYMRLLMAQHQHGHLSEKQMLHICKSYDKDIFIKFIQDDNGMFFNRRLDEEIFKRKKYTDSRSNNKSGRKASKNEDLEEITKESYDLHMEDENKDINYTIVINSIMQFFNFNEIANFDKMKECLTFLKLLNHQKKIDEFKLQFEAYKKLKLANPKFTHSFKNFIGTAKGLYLDGAWNAENWVLKLSPIIKQEVKLNI